MKHTHNTQQIVTLHKQKYLTQQRKSFPKNLKKLLWPWLCEGDKIKIHIHNSFSQEIFSYVSLGVPRIIKNKERKTYRSQHKH